MIWLIVLLFTNSILRIVNLKGNTEYNAKIMDYIDIFALPILVLLSFGIGSLIEYELEVYGIALGVTIKIVIQIIKR